MKDVSLGLDQLGLDKLGTITGTITPTTDVIEADLRICRLLDNGIDAIGADALRALLTQTTFSELLSIHEQAVAKRETDFADSIIVGKSRVSDYVNFEIAMNLLEAEANLADIQPNDHVVFIGSGAFPVTALLLSQIRGPRITCVDSSADACNKSRALIEALKLDHRIKVQNLAGQDRGLHDASVVIVAMEAYPKDDIFHNIWQNTPFNVRILARESDSARQIFYPRFDPTSFENGSFNLRGIYKEPKSDIVSRLYLPNRPKLSRNGRIS